jgi:hypothetical protein
MGKLEKLRRRLAKLYELEIQMAGERVQRAQKRHRAELRAANERQAAGERLRAREKAEGRQRVSAVMTSPAPPIVVAGRPASG